MKERQNIHLDDLFKPFCLQIEGTENSLSSPLEVAVLPGFISKQNQPHFYVWTRHD